MSVPAWLVTLANGSRVALGSHWMREVIGAHERELYPMFTVPLLPQHCHQLMYWQNLLIPVMQLEALVAIDAPASTPYHVVVAVPPLAGEDHLGYGVIGCCALPEQISVSDTQPIDYPSPAWAAYAASCFAYQDAAIPILDTGKIFNIFAN